MDEVLASLQRGRIQLRKVPAPKTASRVVDLRSNLMSAIRLGVTLKKVRFSARIENTAKPRDRLMVQPGYYVIMLTDIRLLQLDCVSEHISR